jgi:hypothetical protein
MSHEGNGVVAAFPWSSYPIQTALFDDGTLVWRVEQGQSFGYVQARVDSDTVARMARDLEAVLGEVPQAEWRHYGLDAACNSLVLRTPRGAIAFDSWHDDDPNSRLVADQHGGLVARNGRTNEQVEREWSSGYRAFRTAWSEAVASLDQLKPTAGTPLASAALDVHLVREPAFAVAVGEH